VPADLVMNGRDYNAIRGHKQKGLARVDQSLSHFVRAKHWHHMSHAPTGLLHAYGVEGDA
jgi:hypothetical protein